MDIEVRKIDALMWGLWHKKAKRWLEAVDVSIIHSPSKEFLENGYLVNYLAENGPDDLTIDNVKSIDTVFQQQPLTEKK